MFYLFELGHQPNISTAELEAVFSKIGIEKISQIKKGSFLIIETKNKINPSELIKILGGTVKIAEQISNTGDLTQNLADFIEKKQPQGKIRFSISEKNAKKIALDTKKILKSRDRSVRYIEANNTATVLHNKLVDRQSDFTILENNIFVTKAIHTFEDFSKRDYGRPGSDDKSGMLPPKLARILTNLSRADKNNSLLDPFCGSGTILMEAAALGYTNLFGADKSDKAIKDTKTNLEWIKKEFNLKNFKHQLIVSDITNLPNQIKKESIKYIITEPYLGKPLTGRETKDELQLQADELKDLYISSFKAFGKILEKKGVVIFIIPRFRYKDDWVKINCLNNIKKLGFSLLAFSEKEESLLYWRTKQHLGREIWKFVKK